MKRKPKDPNKIQNIPSNERIKEYKRIIGSMAHKYVRGRAEYEDLIQEAFVGLVLAEKDFEPERSEDFRTYAITRMRGKMYEYGIRNDTLISIPTHVAKAVSYIRQMDKLLDKELSQHTDDIRMEILRNRTAEPEKTLTAYGQEKLISLKKRLENIARNSKITYETLASLALESLSLVVSEDALFKHSSSEQDIDVDMIDQETRERLQEALGPKQYYVISLRLCGYSYREIAEHLSQAGYKNNKGNPISRQAVKGILDSARKTIKSLDILPVKKPVD
jgi:RNA polymerase sigma-B factor